MAMNFMQANRPEEAPLTQAAIAQSQIAAALRQQKQNEMQMYGSAASKLGSMAPEGAWGKLGNAMMGKTAAAGGMAPALAGLGPMGWAALLAGGFLMKDMFKKDD
jgi:hypothetical protein